MLVVDRRDDAGKFELGANRSFVQESLENALYSSNIPNVARTGADAAAAETTIEIASKNVSAPAPVQVDTADQVALATSDGAAGVACVVKTPGPNALVEMMLERIWGVCMPHNSLGCEW